MSDLDKIAEWIEREPTEEGNYEDGWDNDWSEFAWESQGNGVDVPGVGLVRCVEDFGGEGQGDNRWIVLEANGHLYRKDGYYASFEGSTWDGDFYEVEKVSVEKFEYRRKK